MAERGELKRTMKNCDLGKRIACSSLTFRELPLLGALEAICRNNFEFVNISIIPPEFCPHFDVLAASEEDIKELKLVLKRRDLTPLSLDIVPGYFNSGDPLEIKDFIRKSILAARAIGARIVTVPSGVAVDSSLWQANVKTIKPHIREMADYAERNGITFSIEAPHVNTLAEDIDQASRLFDLLDDKRILCTFDTSHVTRGRRSSLIEGLYKIGVSRIAQIHLRDSLQEDISITPGKGQADFIPFVRQLKEFDYKGYLVFELENKGYITRQKERELKFAYSYIQNIIRYGDVSFPQKIVTSRAYQIVERFRHNPKAEIKRHRRLHHFARTTKTRLGLLVPIKTYEGIWKNRWRFRRDRVVEHRPKTMILVKNPERMVKVGIVGCGWAGARMHGPGFQRLNNVRIVGVVDVDELKALEAARRLTCNPYNELHEMIEQENPDLVSVCTREWQHYEPTMELLNSGFDVFCEKIMASRFEHGVRMVEASERNGRVLAVNYNYRFMPGVRKIKEIREKRYLGELAFIDIKVHAFSYHHALDLVSFLGGKIKSVSAYFRNDNSIRDFGGTDWSRYDEDILYVPSVNVSATFELENGVLATINSSCYLNHLGFILSIDAVFERGAVSLTGLTMFDTVGILSYATREKLIGFDWNHKKGVFSRGYEYTFYKSIESFMTSFIAGKPPETSAEHGLFVMKLEKAVTQSYRAGCRVDL